MQTLKAFLQLVRWPNLVFIILTQALYYFCVVVPVLNVAPQYGGTVLLILASVFIAAGGYVINDYFDLNIDQVNKPERTVLNKTINRRWAILWHSGLSMLGLLLTIVALGAQKWYLVLANAVAVLLLWLYSTSLKKGLLVGNVLIALLTAWTLLILFFREFSFETFFAAGPSFGVITRITFMYAAFAFITTLVREAVKDAEDMEGDRRWGCKTMPIVMGLQATRLYNAVWMVVLLAALLFLQIYVIRFQWWLMVLYTTATVLIPAVVVFRKNFTAVHKADFSYLSNRLKWMMLAGICSMVFFLFYF